MSTLRTLYPPIEPYNSGMYKVDETHTIYWEESGNPKGKPVLFLHGGPGAGTNPSQRCFFDASHYRIILIDQRGCGRSTPYASLENNTTWHLVEDIEKIRTHLKIDNWIVFGGSWGSTLSLAYAQTHPNKVKGLILRGIFLCRRKEIHWFYQFGTHHLFPDEWEKYLAPIPEEERHDLLSSYYKRLTSSNKEVRQAAAKAWTCWEGATLRLQFDQKTFSSFTDDQHCDAIARIECHYFMNNSFLSTDNWLIENVGKIKHIPAYIIHGRYDVICPLENAWELHKAWPEATLEIVPAAGHAASELGITDALVRATDNFKKL